MNIEIGCDIEDINRFKKCTKSFLNRVFTKDEQRYCLSKSDPAKHFAARWCAKEAVIKAMSSMKQRPKSYKQIEISNLKNGRPMVKVVGSCNITIKLSLSHSKNTAMATVLVMY